MRVTLILVVLAACGHHVTGASQPDANASPDAMCLAAPCNTGAVECVANGVQTCQLDANGCAAWSAVVACPDTAPFCSAGTCAAQCTDECSSGQSECDANGSIRICGQYDNDPCLDWSPPMSCTGNQTCIAGICASPVECVGQGTTCDDGNPCTIGDSCNAGICSGAPKCNAPDHGSATCAADGTCGFSCDPGYKPSGSSCVPSDTYAAMATAKSNHVAVTAQDGKIYVTGGDCNLFTTRTLAYDPSADSWIERAPIPVGAPEATAALGNDGKIYVFGGSACPGTDPGTQIYDPATNIWTRGAEPPRARASGAAVLAPDHKIYVIGGSVSQVDAYDPATNTWSTPSSIPHIYFSVAAALGSDGLIYAAGGDGFTSSLAIYDPVSSTWTSGPAIPSTTIQFEYAAGQSGKLYVFGGEIEIGQNYSPIDTVFALDLATKTWQSRESMPTKLMNAAAATAPSGDIFVTGGVDTHLLPQTAIYRYVPTTDSW